jgi:hypothetical protein
VCVSAAVKGGQGAGGRGPALGDEILQVSHFIRQPYLKKSLEKTKLSHQQMLMTGFFYIKPVKNSCPGPCN